MAMHDFECLKCGEKFEKIIPSCCAADKQVIECPKCKSVEVKKLISKLQMIKDLFCNTGG